MAARVTSISSCDAVGSFGSGTDSTRMAPGPWYTAAPAPARDFGNRMREVVSGGIERGAGAHREPLLTPRRLRLDKRDGGVVGGRRGNAKEPDRAAADDGHAVAWIDTARRLRGVVCDG